MKKGKNAPQHFSFHFSFHSRFSSFSLHFSLFLSISILSYIILMSLISSRIDSNSLSLKAKSRIHLNRLRQEMRQWSIAEGEYPSTDFDKGFQPGMKHSPELSYEPSTISRSLGTEGLRHLYHFFDTGFPTGNETFTGTELRTLFYFQVPENRRALSPLPFFDIGFPTGNETFTGTELRTLSIPFLFQVPSESKNTTMKQRQLGQSMQLANAHCCTTLQLDPYRCSQ